MKIKRLQIEGFQSHKQSVLEFSPGVNAIIGESDAGKSAIIRAIRLLLYNEPAGDGFISKLAGAPPLRIKMEFDEAPPITLTYEDGKRVYYVGDERFHGFGRNVPQAVKEAFPVNELNIQKQLDAPFLVSETPGAVGQLISDLLGLQDVQKIFSAIQKEQYAARSSLKRSREELAAVEADLNSYNWVDAAQALVSDLEAEFSEIGELADKLKSYESLLGEFERVTSALNSYGWLDKALELLGSLELDAADLDSAIGRLKSYEDLLAGIESVKRRLDSLEWVAVAADSVDALIGEREGLKVDIDKLAGLTGLLASLERAVIAVREITTEIEALEERFSREIGDVCPLCGNPINKGVHNG